MTAPESHLLIRAAQVGLFLLALSAALVLYRMVKGPKRADRIIALDLLSVLVVSMGSLYAVLSGEAAFLDVAIAYALVAFLGTVAFARYLEKSASMDRHALRKNKTKGERHE